MFPVSDGHCDFLYGAIQSGYDLNNPKREQSTKLADMLGGGVALQFFACWIDITLKTPTLHQCIAMIDVYNRMLEENPELVPLTKDYTPESGKIATVLTVEGGEAVEGSLAVLRVLRKLGVCAMTLTWNDNNELCGAALDKGNKGLSAIGREIIDEMCRIGIAIDVSHISDKTIEQILERATRPVFASHSNARSVMDHPRALTDEQIRAISAQGGTVGVNFYYQQLSKKPTANMEDVLRHIDRVVEIGGIQCCAIGSDFDGMQKYPPELRSSKDFPKLTEALQKRGYSDADIYRIMYQNLRDYIVQFV